MDGQRFDSLVRTVVAPRSRRLLLSGLAAMGVPALALRLRTLTVAGQAVSSDEPCSEDSDCISADPDPCTGAVCDAGTCSYTSVACIPGYVCCGNGACCAEGEADTRPGMTRTDTVGPNSAGTALLAEFVTEIPFQTELSSAPSGVAVTPDGTLYVIDALTDQIRVFDREGNPIATWGEPGSAPGQFRFENAQGDFWGDLALGSDGTLYVMDTFNNRVQVLGPDGAFLREWGKPGSEEGQFSSPQGIAVDREGRVYVAETGNQRVQVFASDGQILATWGRSEAEGRPWVSPADVAIDAAGTVSVTDTATDQMYRVDEEGTLIDAFGETGEQPGQLLGPVGAAVDMTGNLYVAEYGGQRVQVFAPDGTSLGTIGAIGTEPGQFISPIYLAMGPDGMLYVADEGNRRVQVFRLLPPLVPTGTPISG